MKPKRAAPSQLTMFDGKAGKALRPAPVEMSGEHALCRVETTEDSNPEWPDVEPTSCRLIRSVKLENEKLVIWVGFANAYFAVWLPLDYLIQLLPPGLIARENGPQNGPTEEKTDV